MGGLVDLLRSWAGNIRSQLLYMHCLTWLLCYDHCNMSQATGAYLVSLYYFWSAAVDSVLVKHTNLNKECKRYSALTVLCKRMINRTLEKIWITVSVVDKIKVWEPVWTDEKLGSNGTQMEASPIISLCLSAIQSGACIASPCVGTKLFSLWPFEVRAIQELFPPGWEEIRQYYSWFQKSVPNGVLDLFLVFLLAGTWFTLDGNLNSQSNVCWCPKNPCLFLAVCLHQMCQTSLCTWACSVPRDLRLACRILKVNG